MIENYVLYFSVTTAYADPADKGTTQIECPIDDRRIIYIFR